VIVLLLTIVYFLGLGITVIFLMFFNRKILTGNSKNDNTLWVEATGYEADIEDTLRQS
jgi:cytochrome c biogenesis protein CcdA